MQRAKHLISLTALVFVLASCTNPAGNDDSDSSDTVPVIDRSEIGNALQAAVTRFPEYLPPGVTWPIDAPHVFDQTNEITGEPILVHKDVADMVISEHWLCAWTDNLLSATQEQRTGDVETALRQIEKYPNLPEVEKNVDNPDEFTEYFVKPAQAGDISLIREFYETSCFHFSDLGLETK